MAPSVGAVADPNAEPAAAEPAAMRIGHGFDVHPFVSDDSSKPLVLGGAEFVGSPPLAGHSNADAVAHAVIDAMLSAAGLGDIGSHFSDTDERWRGADSIAMLRSVTQMLSESGWRLVNADCTVICDRPKIAPAREQMQRRLSEAAGGPVTVCGKRTEGVGGADAVTVHAVALIAQHKGNP